MTTTRTEWLGVEDLAAELGVPTRTIYTWRYKGTGPRAGVFGKHLRFRREDVDRWIATRMDETPTTPAA